VYVENIMDFIKDKVKGLKLAVTPSGQKAFTGQGRKLGQGEPPKVRYK